MRINNIEVNHKFIDINYTKGFDIKANYIVLHSILEEEFYSIDDYVNYVSKNDKAKESVHYVVSDKEIINLLSDSKRALHVKGSRVREISNSTSIGISFILRDYMNPSDVFENIVKLVRALTNKYKIDLKNIVRHSDISDCICPLELKEDFIWHKFKLRISGINDLDNPVGKAKINSVLSKIKVKKSGINDSNIVGYINRGEEVYIYEEGEKHYKTIIESGRKMIFGFVSKDFLEYKKLSIEDLFEEELEIRKLSELEEQFSEAIEFAECTEKSIKAKEIEENIVNKEGVIHGANINIQVRKGPDLNEFVLAYLLNGTKIKVIEDRDSWCKIEYDAMFDKRCGFIEKDYIKFD